MMANRIIVTGGDGQLGNCLRDLSSRYKSYEFIFTDVAQLDITDEKAIADFFKAQKPKWVINAAAYTAVDKAESEPEKAQLLNATAVENLARQSKSVGAALVQISTDYVFDGNTEEMLTEEMPVNPQSVYGVTKLAGEKAAALNPAHIILRTSWLYSAYGNNFVKTMRRLASERTELSVVADQWGSPTLADDLAEAIMTAIVAADKGEDVYGTYHYSNEGATCWADFASHIMTLSSLECHVKGITTAEYPTAATRPHFSVMSKSKFKNKFKVVIPEWELSLEYLIHKME
ncbi:MAG: dTDP-4-dehydrorhamnose reductase [Rikenellaceae bacterium]